MFGLRAVPNGGDTATGGHAPLPGVQMRHFPPAALQPQKMYAIFTIISSKFTRQSAEMMLKEGVMQKSTVPVIKLSDST